MKLASALLTTLTLLGASSALADDAKTKVKIGKGGVSVETGGTKVKVEDPDDNDSDEVEEAAGSGAAKAGVFTVTGNNQKVSHACGGVEKGATVVEITGNNHSVTLTGPCTKLTVVGNGHTVTTDEIGSIQATGNNLSVGWKKATTGAHPQIKKTGNGIKISKIEKN